MEGCGTITLHPAVHAEGRKLQLSLDAAVDRRLRSLTHVRAMETTSNASGRPETAAERVAVRFLGRNVPLEMGSLRVGGAGRPAPIVTRVRDDGERAAAVESRVVLERHPQSPFGRKRELTTSASFSVDALASGSDRFQVRKRVLTAVEQVHATRHASRRTPLTQVVPVDDVEAQTPPTEKKARIGKTSKTPAQTPAQEKTAKKTRAKPAGIVAESSPHRFRRSRTVRETRKVEINVETTKEAIQSKSQSPQPFLRLDSTIIDKMTRKQALGDTKNPPYHEQQRFHPNESEFMTSPRVVANLQAIPTTPIRSGRREVDDSIDHIYADPSIDFVQFQLMHPSSNGKKRKALERGRVLAAAAEVEKQKQEQTKRIEEQHRRKDQLARMAEEIRNRNKMGIKKSVETGARDALTVSRRYLESDDTGFLTRKPPVPRLSRLGTTPSKRSRKKAPARNKTQAPTGLEDAVDEAANDVDISKMILHDEKEEEQTHSAAYKPTKKRRKSPKTNVEVAPKVQEETLQRREIAREYIVMQKQSRKMTEAKMKDQKRQELQRRRDELQRLEQVRMQELAEAKKRRILQQRRRERASKAKKAKEAAQLSLSDEVLDPTTEGIEVNVSNVLEDTENQSYRGNFVDSSQTLLETNAGLETPVEGTHMMELFKTKDSDASYSQNFNGVMDERVQKLLQLQSRAKQLAEKLKRLSSKQNDARPDETSSTVEYGNEEHNASLQDEEQGSQEGSDEESDGGDEREGSEGSEGDDVDRNGRDEDEAGSDEDDSPFEDDNDEYDDENSSRIRGLSELHHFPTRFEARHEVDDRLFHARDDALFASINNDMYPEEPDFSSIGIQRIAAVWPQTGSEGSDELVDGNPGSASRFKVLASSSSSSSDVEDKLVERWSRSPRLLDDSVEHLTHRLRARSELAPSPASHDSRTSDAMFKFDGTGVSPPSSVDSSPAKPIDSTVVHPRHLVHTARPDASSNEGLLRLIRESDDNLSVIDREAKRLFRLQQARVKKKKEADAERQQQKLLRSLAYTSPQLQEVDDRSESHDSSDDIEVKDSNDYTVTTHTPFAPMSRLEYEKLDAIIQAVETTAASTAAKSEEDYEAHQPQTGDDRHARSHVRFWDGLVAGSSGESKAPARHVEMDTRELSAQRERQRMESEPPEPDRSHSPRTLAKQLMAAVEYHEAVHDAHLQLVIMERAQTLEQVQQDTLALAQAYKAEVETNLASHQLVAEHAALEKRFDADLQQISSELENAQQAEQEQYASETRRLQEELRVASLRECSAQTEGPVRADVATSARLRMEASTATEVTRIDSSIQYESPEKSPIVPPNEELTNAAVEEDQSDEYSEGYDDETFDQASTQIDVSLSQKQATIRAPSATSSIAEEEEGEEAVSSTHDARSLSDEIQSVVESSVSKDDPKTTVEGASEAESEIVSEDGDLREVDSVGSIAESDDGIEEHSDVSVGYEEDDFEVESPSRTQVKSSADAISEVEDDDDGDDVVSQHEEASESIEDEDEDGIVHVGSRSHSEENSVYSEEFNDSMTATKDKLQAPTAAVSVPARVIQETPQFSQVAPTPFEPLIGTAFEADASAELYVQQLQMRKQSEETLLDLRCRAMEAKTHREMQSLQEAINNEEKRTDRNPQRLSELLLRNEALKMSFMSEKAHIEGQKAACMARYYQDLLAFQSLAGDIATLPSLSAPPILPSFPSMHSVAVPAPVNSNNVFNECNPTLADASSRSRSDVDKGSEYDDDGFASVEDDAKSFAEEATAISEVKSIESGDSSAPKDDFEDYDDIASAHSQEDEEISVHSSATKEEEEESAIASVTSHEYEEEDFASITESRDQAIAEIQEDEQDEQEQSGSVKSASIPSEHGDGGEGENEVEEDQPDDDAEVTYGEDFAFMSEQAPEQTSDVNDDDEIENTSDKEVESEDAASVVDEEASRRIEESTQSKRDEEYDADEFEASEASAVHEPHAHEESSVLVSQSDDSSTTKLLVAEVAQLQQQIQQLDHFKKSEQKLERKKVKAIELLRVKEQLLIQEKEKFRIEEEQKQIDLIAEKALAVNVNAEVEKAKFTIKEKLAEEIALLQQKYSDLVAQPVVKEEKMNKPTTTGSKSAAPVLPERTEVNDAPAEYEDGAYDDEDYEVDSFEKDASVTQERAEKDSNDGSEYGMSAPEAASEVASEATSSEVDDVEEDDIEEDEAQEEVSHSKSEVEDKDGESAYEDEYADESFDDVRSVQSSASPIVADEANVLPQVSVQYDDDEKNEGKTVASTVNEDGDGDEEEYSDDGFDRMTASEAGSETNVPDKQSPEDADVHEVDDEVASKPESQYDMVSDDEESPEPLEMAIQEVTSQLDGPAAEPIYAPKKTESAERPQEHIMVNIAVSIPDLGASVSMSHDDDLLTRSIEEQTKRLEELRQRIEQRKDEIQRVQKQMRVEQKKEHLREQEHKLWADMELLEDQLGTQARILALSQQRNRLEVMQLEAKHGVLTRRENAIAEDLLEGYDYVEAVEVVREPAVKKDLEVQVQLLGFTSETRTHDLFTADEYVEEDLLLAYDYVEPAERVEPPTRVEVPVASVRNDVMVGGHEDETLSQHELVPQSIEDATIDADELDEEDQSHEEGSAPAVCEDPEQESELADVVEVYDLLAGYTYVEDVEPVLSIEVQHRDEDILADYDFVEDVEPVPTEGFPIENHEPSQSSVDSSIAAIVPMESISDQVGFQDKDQSVSFEPSDHEVNDPGQGQASEPSAEDEQTTEGQAESFDVQNVPGSGDERAPSDEEEELNDLSDIAKEDSELSESVGELSGDEADPYQQLFEHSQSHVFDAKEANPVDNELVSRVTDLVFADLFQELQSEMETVARSEIHRRRRYATARATFGHSSTDIQPTTARESEVDSHQSDNDSIANVSEAEEVLEDDVEDAETSGYEQQDGTPDNTDSEVLIDKTSSIADSIFQKLLNEAMSLELEVHSRKQKKRHLGDSSAQPGKPAHPVASSLSTLTQPSLSLTAQMSDRQALDMILEQMRVIHDEVSFNEVSAQRRSPQFDALFDAVNDSAISALRRLKQDVSFQNESAAQKKKLLCEHIISEMSALLEIQASGMKQIDRFTRRVEDDERGDLDRDDLALLRAQHRSSVSAITARIRETTLVLSRPDSRGRPSGATESSIAPPLRRRRSGLSKGITPIAQTLMSFESQGLTDRITDQLMDGIVQSELARGKVRR